MMNSVSIGKDNHIGHSWCILFGDGLSTTKDYDMRFSSNVSIPSAIDINDLQSALNKRYEDFVEHSKGPGLPGRPANWIGDITGIFMKINMILGKAVGCQREGCGNTASTSVCEKCRRVKYCSVECKEKDAPEHLSSCIKVEVKTRDPESAFSQYLYSIESSSEGLWKWTPSDALERGLFAKRDIKKGEVIVLFEGEVTTKEGLWEDDEWYLPFPDGKAFVPSKYDIAHVAMDPSFTSPDIRHLAEVLESPVSMITTVANVTNIISRGSGNACNSLLVFSPVPCLVASTNIRQGDEIFFHRGFAYHFLSECKRGWFCGGPGLLPVNVCSSPGFKAYVSLYHPEAEKMYISPIGPAEESDYHIQLVIPRKKEYGRVFSREKPMEVAFEKLRDIPPGTEVVSFDVPNLANYLSEFV